MQIYSILRQKKAGFGEPQFFNLGPGAPGST